MSSNTPTPDILAIVLQTVREELLRQDAANADTFDDALADAELRARRILGGARHYIQRLPRLEGLHAIELLPANLTVAQMAERTGLPASTVRRLLAQSRARLRRGAANE